MAAWVYLSNPSSRINRFWAIFCVAVAIWGFGGLAVGLSTSYDKALLSWRLAYVGVIFIPTLFYHFVVMFLGLQRRKPLVCAYITSIFFEGLNATGILIPTVTRIFPDIYYLYPPRKIYTVFVLYFVFMTVISHVKLYQFLRSSNESKRRTQVLWFFIALAIAFSGGTTCYLPVYGIDLYPYGNFTVPLYPLIMSYAIIRHQLMDIRIVIRRSLVYSLLVACITGLYLVMVLIMERWFQGFFGYRSVFATALVAFLIAIFFNPLRTCIQAFVDRALFKATPAELAAQREQLLAEVRKSDQMKSVATLAAGLAHEIKNPLASIKTFTEHLEMRYANPGFRAKFQKIVRGEVEHINLIVQQLLEFAKPVPPKLTPVEVPRLLDETLELLSNELLQRRVEVVRRYAASPRVLADPQQLKQVFLNLFLNSLQAMNGVGRLEIGTASTGSALTVTVVDNGIGIAPKDLPRVFEPFYTTKSNGTGLGLAIVHGIVKEHRGRIEIASRLGEGTRITMLFPLATESGLV
jgi:signal transduction histidine kinase